MKLTLAQKKEISDYIINIPKFRETYNELYDHILNSLENNEEKFSLDAVDRIVDADFYGYYEITHQEKNLQKQLNRKYNRLFLLEMLNTFKLPQLVNNLIIFCLCYFLYKYGTENLANLKPLVLSLVLLTVVITIFGYLVVFVRKYKYLKFSILDNYIMFESSFGMIMVSFIMSSFLSKENFFEIADQTKLIITLSLFFFTSVYARAFIKFYNQKIKVL